VAGHPQWSKKFQNFSDLDFEGGRTTPKGSLGVVRPPQGPKKKKNENFRIWPLGVVEATPWLNWGGRQPPIEWPATLVFLFYFNIFIFLKKLINILLAGLGWPKPPLGSTGVAGNPS
jgi:hypothetical protein